MSATFYSPIARVENTDARVEATGLLRLKKGESRIDKSDGKPTLYFSAYTATIKCPSLKPPTPQSAVRVYIHGTTEGVDPLADDTIISASGCLAFGVRGRPIALHFHIQNVHIWPADSKPPPGLGVLNCHFTGVIGKMSAKTEPTGIALRWEVDLLREGKAFKVLTLLPSISESTASDLRRKFVMGRLAHYTSHLAQIGLGNDPKLAVFSIHSMQSISYPIKGLPGSSSSAPIGTPSNPEARTSLSPSPTPPLSTVRKRDAPSPSPGEASSKKARQDDPSTQQASTSVPVVRESKSGRTANLAVIDTQRE